MRSESARIRRFSLQPHNQVKERSELEGNGWWISVRGLEGQSQGQRVRVKVRVRIRGSGPGSGPGSELEGQGKSQGQGQS